MKRAKKGGGKINTRPRSPRKREEHKSNLPHRIVLCVQWVRSDSWTGHVTQRGCGSYLFYLCVAKGRNCCRACAIVLHCRVSCM